ncbi:class I SAM-dependent methyltransferase [Candidatus Falkowbacteria bacterium]|nr:class I SAM-dependent methyltransferase [Candidatus Falkowbacteria bacterium]
MAMTSQTVSKILELTKSGYQTIAQDFSNTRNFLWQDLQLFKDYIKDSAKMLDLGCGNGRLIQLLEGKNVDYLGIDYNEEFISIAKAKYPQYKFEVGDVQNLAMPMETFDVVTLIAVLNHLPGEELKKRILANVASYLKPNGYLLMTNWDLWNWGGKKSVRAFWQDQLLLSSAKFSDKYGINKEELGYRDIITLWQSGDKQKVARLYYYAFTRRELDELLESVGLRIVKSVKTENNFVHIAKKSS